ncbi:glycosyltransferase family 4 protein [Sphingobacterium suaedae]|uniref:Glycosyltransferase family 4 protein n=1 Tax=Sphingobacterium suaedae TaxID=1686402 RepID=A0ABW5KMB0_9SPHI
MRIFVIHNFYQHAGGEDVVFRQEVDALSKEHEVAVFTIQNKKGIKGMLQYMSYPFNKRMSRQITETIVQFRPEVVHIHNMHYAMGPWFIRAIVKRNIPIVCTLHNFRLLCPSASLFFKGKIFTDSLHEDFPWKAIRLRVLDHSFVKTFVTGFTYWLHRKLGTWQAVARYIVLSDFARTLFQQSTFPVHRDKFVVRPNALSVIEHPQERSQRFLYIGRLAEEKGILPLLAAFADLPFHLDIYGTGPQRRQVEAMVHKHPNLHYHGFQPQDVLAEAICQTTALIVPSVCFEGMPMTIIEAFAQGTPVLASNIGILAEMVLPLSTGMRFDPFSGEDIRKTIVAWAHLDAAKKKEIAMQCQLSYRRQYTLTANMDRLLTIYQQVIAEQRA